MLSESGSHFPRCVLELPHAASTTYTLPSTSRACMVRRRSRSCRCRNSRHYPACLFPSPTCILVQRTEPVHVRLIECDRRVVVGMRRRDTIRVRLALDRNVPVVWIATGA